MALSCGQGVFTGVSFASYGLPIQNGSCSFSHNSVCDAPSSSSVVAAACVGRSICYLDVGVATFGPDPCPGVYKFLAVSLTGDCSEPAPGTQVCSLAQYSRTFSFVNDSSTNSTYYQRLQPRDDSPATRAIPYKLSVPTGGVTLNGGVLEAASNASVAYLLSHYTVDNLLFNFRDRAGQPQPPGAHCMGWDCKKDWIEGSPAGLFLMGAGGHLRWKEDATLRAMMDELIDGIENCTEEDGWLSAYTQEKMATDEHPDYTTSWTVHGFLEAAIAGNAKALP